MYVKVKGDATVDEVIGYCLFEYVNEQRIPALPGSMLNVSNWNIRIVEDDGAVDDDFPGTVLMLALSIQRIKDFYDQF